MKDRGKKEEDLRASGALDALRVRGKGALAQALAELERNSTGQAALLDAAYRRPRGHVIGVTGPPGVGKSTLVAALISEYRRGTSGGAPRSVGVIAVDPSSRRSGGALLGDRVRLATDPEDVGVYVRSMAARDRLGGLAEITLGAMVLMRALFDVVLIETVGVGQSETDVGGVADTVLFCVQPGSGDSLQFMKAGIVEVPHIAVVTKADMAGEARRALADVTGALSLAAGAPSDGWRISTLAVSAVENRGVAELQSALDGHMTWLRQEDRLNTQRGQQAVTWMEESLKEGFGREGLAWLRRHGRLPLRLAEGESPFATLHSLTEELRTLFRG